MIKREDVYKIGRLGKSHGVKGELQFAFDDDVFDRTEADHLVLDIDGILVPFFFEEYRFKSDDVALVKFEGIDTGEQAQALTNVDVYFERQAAHDASGELSLAQIIGFSVYSHDAQEPLGLLEAVDDSTENILFMVKKADGETLLLPCNEDFIDMIDPQQRRIVMSLPEGLLDL